MSNLKARNIYPASLALIFGGILAGCSQTSMPSRHVSTNIRRSLDRAGLRDISVSQDRMKGIVILGGHTAADYDMTQAESIAASFAGRETVLDHIELVPFGSESLAFAMNSDLDNGIETNLDTILVQNKLHESVKFDVRHHVVTLTGGVDSQTRRAQAESVASSVPNVWRVVNQLWIKSRSTIAPE